MGCGATKSLARDQRHVAVSCTTTPTVAPTPDGSHNEKASSSSLLLPEDADACYPDETEFDGKARLVMRKYIMHMEDADIMGEGTSSICYRGTDRESSEEVAIKVYKETQAGSRMRKFERQVRVLLQLQEPFAPPEEPELWHDELAGTKPSRLFMQLLDYSKDGNGKPAPDPVDGELYVITELAQYSLKDYLANRRDQGKGLPSELIRKVTKAIVQVIAGLHAKGFVHIDLKPENMMMFSGRLKLIDVDGCMRKGDMVSITDSSISFSPCYCAPEWAEFLIEDSDEHDSRIRVMPALDVWSTGMTICELVTLDAILKPMYGKFLRSGSSHREAGFLFMDWLSRIQKVPLPKAVKNYDREFVDLLVNHLLVRDPQQRRSCAQCLSHPYIVGGAVDMLTARGSSTEQKAPVSDVSAERPSDPNGAVQNTGQQQASLRVPDRGALPTNSRELGDLPITREVPRRSRAEQEDHTHLAPRHQGVLFKLNSSGDPQDPAHWLKRDFWLASNGSLCYYSIKDSKRLVMVESSKLVEATVLRFEGGAMQSAFEVRFAEGDQADADFGFIFGCKTEEALENWIRKIKEVAHLEHVGPMRLGAGFAEELKTFKLKVKNRRRPVKMDSHAEFEPVFKASLWKVKADGDRMREQDWVLREMWIAQNGSLVYWSKKEDRELVYYTGSDISNASFLRLADEDSLKPFTFQVTLPPSEGVEFAPGEFAATSEELLERWLEAFAKVKD